MGLNSVQILRLEQNEYIDSCYAEYCAGPGWSNWVIWVYIGTRGQNIYRKESVQTEEIEISLFGEIIALSQMSNIVQPLLKQNIISNNSLKK